MSLDKVTIRPEQVSNSKVCTSEAEGDNMSLIDNDNLLELELPFLPIEANTPRINISEETPPSPQRTPPSPTIPPQSTRVSEQGNKGQYLWR